jgi:hypothetical protein
MSLSRLIYGRSQAVTGLTALVGTKVSPNMRRADTTLPAVTYDIENEDRLPDLNGANIAYMADVQFRCMADLLGDAYSIAYQVSAAFNGHSGYSDATGRITKSIVRGISAIGLAADPPPNDTDSPREVVVSVRIFYTLV